MRGKQSHVVILMQRAMVEAMIESCNSTEGDRARPEAVLGGGVLGRRESEMCLSPVRSARVGSGHRPDEGHAFRALYVRSLPVTRPLSSTWQVVQVVGFARCGREKRGGQSLPSRWAQG